MILLPAKRMFGIMEYKRSSRKGCTCSMGKIAIQKGQASYEVFSFYQTFHIGLKLINRDLREDQEYILHQITELAVQEQPDALVIAGDIYDKAVPSAEAMEVLDGFISELTEKLPDLVIMMISGNHDSAIRVNCYRNVLARQNLHMTVCLRFVRKNGWKKLYCRMHTDR